MANKITMKFKKGDTVNHSFRLPIGDYSEGGSLWFAAKPDPDNDPTDAAAVIDKEFTDDDVTLDATWATWALAFDADDISNVNFSNGEKKKTYIGEFQYVVGDSVHTFPSDDNFIEVIIYADVKRGIS